MKCKFCGSEKTYLFAILNGVEVFDCSDCHKRTKSEKKDERLIPINQILGKNTQISKLKEINNGKKDKYGSKFE